MALSKYDNVLETRFVAPTPPLLTKMSREAFHVFRKQYNRYLQLIGVEQDTDGEETEESKKIKRVAMHKCVDEDLGRAIAAEYGAEMMENDTKFGAFVIAQAAVTSVEQAKAMYRAVRMDMRIRDITERISAYNSAFLQVRDQTEEIGWKEKRICLFYIDGLRPDRVQNTLTELTETKAGKSLDAIMKKAKELLVAENHLFASSSASHESPNGHSHRHHDREHDRDHHYHHEHHEHSHRNEHTHKDEHSHHVKLEANNVMEHEPIRCFNCNEVGHGYRQCKKPMSPEMQRRLKNNKGRDGRHPRGNFAGKHHGSSHHNVNNVEVLSQSQSDAESTSSSSESLSDVESQQSGGEEDEEVKVNMTDIVTAVALANPEVTETKDKKKPVLCRVWIQQQSFIAVVDTGAAVSCISQAMLNQLPTGAYAMASELNQVQVRMPDGNVVACNMARMRVKLYVREHKGLVMTDWAFVILPDDLRQTLLLGADILHSLCLLDDEKLIIPRMDKPDDDDQDDGDDIDTSAVFVAPITQTSVKTSQVNLVTVPDTPIKGKVMAILSEVAEVFDVKLEAAGIDCPPMKIVLRPEAPALCSRPRPLPKHVRTAVYQVIKEWQDTSVIEHGNLDTGRYASALVVVKKKQELSSDKKPPWPPDGLEKPDVPPSEIRICVDFRDINFWTVPIASPMMNINAIAECAAGCPYYAKFDLTNGYLQMMLDLDSRDYTGFVTESDFYRFIRVPFGLRNAPQWFQMMMNTMFRDMLYVAVIIFVDDMLVFGKTEEEFLHNLRAVLVRCKERRIRLKAKKSMAGSTEVDVVGLHLSKNGKQPSATSIEAVLKLSPPRNKEQLGCIIGKFNYFRPFICECSKLLEPLTVLQKQGTRFEWNAVHEQAFSALKSTLASVTSLVHITESSTLVLQTDASDKGIGATVLARDAEGVERPAIFLSKRFTGPQLRWPTVQQELYAIVWTLTRPLYASLFKMCHFTIRTDHKNLVYLHRMADTSKMLLGWKLLLQDYDFDIIHIPGKANAPSDCLSRLFDVNAVEDEEEEEHNDNHPVAQAEATPDEEEEEHDDNHEENEPVDEDYHLHVVMITQAHGGVNGHYGRKATLRRLSEMGYHWENMKSHVRRFLKACIECQKVKAAVRRLRKSYPLRTTAVYLPFRVVAVDALGPFPMTNAGFMYILVFIDCFTRWSELVPTRTLEAAEAADAFMTNIFSRHGLPLIIRSDNGKQFVNNIIASLLDKLRIQHHRVLEYAPTSNGIVERDNREIIEQIRCLCLEFGRSYAEWNELVPLVMFIINRTTHSSIGTSPHRMLYGDLWDPIGDTARLLGVTNMAEPQIQHEHNTRRNRQSVLERFPELRVEVRDAALMYIDKVSACIRTIHRSASTIQQHMVLLRNDRHNRNAQERVFENGDLVLRADEEVHPSRGKMTPVLHGPYKVIGKEDGQEVVYRLEDIVNPGKFMSVHGRCLVQVIKDDTYPPDALLRSAQHDAEELDVVEVITHRGVMKSTLEFQVKLAGIDELKWLPLKNMIGCTLLEDYLDEHVDVRSLVYPARRQ